MAQASAVAPQPQEQRTSIFATVIRMMLFYFVISKAMSYFFSPSPSTSPGTKERPASHGFMNSILEHQDFTLAVYLHSERVRGGAEEPVWEEQSLFYDFSDSNYRNFAFNMTLTPALQQNGTLYMTAEARFSHRVLKDTIPLTRHKEILQESSINLLSGEAEMETKGSGVFAMHWVPAIDINMMVDQNAYSPGALPPQLKRIKFYFSEQSYDPIFYCSDFWVLRDTLIPLNDTISQVPLTLTFSTIGLFKHSFLEQFSQSNEMLESYGMGSEGEFEIMKRMFLEANPYFLAITLAVSVLHTIFEFMAFKSDIEFWKTRTTLRGLSTKLLLYNFVSTLIIALYLLDSQETSYLVLIPMLLGVLLEFWKLTKGFDVGIKSSFPFVSLKEKESHKEGGTDVYDNTATRFLSYMLLPLVLGYSIYSLYTDTYKSWYNYVLRSLARFIYTTGFIMMTPQLYINYKLKSVEHMPWKVLTYKALNTFIDDMFAFIISMPTMHRIACFRDDIIFIVYVYQRYKYRVDPNRHYLETEVGAREKTE